MRLPLLACVVSSAALLLLGPAARADDAKAKGAPAPDPVEVASVEAAAALDPGVTRVRLPAAADDAVLAGLARLKSLVAIDAAATAVTEEGLRGLSAIGSLRELDLSRCAGINPAAVEVLGGLRKLEVLRLAGSTGLDDAALAPLGKLPKLRVLDLSDCTGLGDGAIKALRELDKLEELDLSGVPLSPLGTVHLVRMRGLKVLRLARAKLLDQSMLEIVALRELESLTVSGNPDFGYIGLQHLSGLRKLKTLVASGLPTVTDDALARASKMPTLESLDFSNCAGIGDVGISALAASPALRSLDVSRTHLTGKGLLALAKSKSLRSLRVAGCPDVKPADVEAARAAMPSVTIATE